MPPPIDINLLLYEEKLIITLETVKYDASLSIRRATETYQVDRKTLSNRRAGMSSRRDTNPNRSKLTKLEEYSLVIRIRDLYLRESALCYAEVRDMADQLLPIRHGDRVGECRVQRFI